MNKQEKLEATAIIAPVIRANAKANNKRKVTTYDQATGKTVRETTVLVLQDSLLAKVEILGVDVKQELKRAEGGCRKCGELRKSKFTSNKAEWCKTCCGAASKCGCGNRVCKDTWRIALRSGKLARCSSCASQSFVKPRLHCYQCGTELGGHAVRPYEINRRQGKDPLCNKCANGRKSTLRLISQRGKAAASGSLGTSPFRGGYMARVVRIYIGTFKTRKEAAIAYDIAVCDMLGINAICNFGEAMYI